MKTEIVVTSGVMMSGVMMRLTIVKGHSRVVIMISISFTMRIWKKDTKKDVEGNQTVVGIFDQSIDQTIDQPVLTR